MATWEIHSDKQEQALFGHLDQGYRITACTTGIQWGKTSVGVHWLKLLMHLYRDKSDNFIITSPTFPIMSQSTLPPFLALMDGYGHYDKKHECFVMYNGGTCWFRTGVKPDSIVGITNVRGILCDEAGLYSLYFWENIQGRASFKQAPIMIVTSPYALNWLYKEIIKPKMRDRAARPDVLWVHATSRENPHFPAQEYEDKKKTMDPRRFNMMYGGNFDRMEGLVYDFQEDRNMVEPHELPQGTRYVGGIDWGYTHPFVLKVRAITPDGWHYDVAEFYKTGFTIKDMIMACRQKKSIFGVEKFYADPSRPDNIEELNRAGLTCVGANNDILDGIEHHRDLISSGKYKMFRGCAPHTEDELETYHYPEPKDRKPDQDDKEAPPVDKDNHCLDADRYISIHTHKIIKRQVSDKLPDDPSKMRHDQRLEWLKRRKSHQTERWT